MNNLHFASTRFSFSYFYFCFQKCLQFQLDDTVWQAKQRILAAFAKDLRDALNYGLYLPPINGRAGKFLDEERFLKEYPLQGPIGFLEVSVVK